MKKILITGAGSYIGTSFENYMKKWPDKYQVDTVDMIGDGWKKYDFSGYDTVYHVAGIAHSDNGKISKEKAKLYYEVNTKLTIQTAMKAKKSGVKQFIFMSSAIVYGDSAPIGRSKMITRDTPVSPANCYGDSKVKAENGLRKLEDENFKVVILRPPMIYGKGSKGNYPLMSKLAQKLPVFPKVENCRSMLYIENLMEFVRLMIENEESGTFWPQNKEYSNTSELVQMIAARHGKRVVLVRGCTILLKLMGLATGVVDKAFGNLAYDQKMSKYKDEYQSYSLSQSIKKTECLMRKKAIQLASVASMIDQFNIPNIQILQSLGYEVDVVADFTNPGTITKERAAELKKRLDEMGVCVYDIAIPRTINPIAIYKAYKKVKKLIYKKKYNLLHCHSPIGGVIARAAAKGKRRKGLKVIYTAHGFHFYNGAPLKNWIIFYPIEKFFSRYTDVLITINKEDYKRASEQFYAKKTEYIPGVGVDTEKFAVCKVDKKAKRREIGVKESDFLLLSVSELLERKNQKIVIDALNVINKKGKIDNIVYLVVGQGNMEDEFNHLISEYGLEAHVKLLGFRTDIAELCETVDCFIHFSLREGLGIVPCEAMAAGLPIISVAVNGINDYTEDGVFGCCVNPASIEQMITSIEKMKNDTTFRRTCASNNWKNAKIFDINTTGIASELLDTEYSHLMKNLIRQKKRNELGIDVKDFVIISVGELNDNKNHQAIIKAIKGLDVKYVIVGKGELERYLMRLINELDLNDQVKLLGYRTDIRDLLWMSDCFAFPSKREGLGLAALEGMASGLPVIANNVGGIGDYCIDGVTGGLCKNESEYAEKIKEIIKASTFQTSLHGIVQARSFDVKKTNQIMRNLYSKLC